MNDQAHKLRKLVENRQTAEQRDAFAEESFVRTPRARIIAITSGKGGVGKTNLAVNLAIALTALDKRVLIIDADLGMANVDVVLGTSSQYNFLHLMQEEVSVDDIISEGPCGIKYLSGGSGIEQLANLSYNELKCMMQKLYRCEAFADIILLDTGAGLGKNVLNFLTSSDEVVLVTTPEPTAMTDAYAIMKAYSQYSTAPIRLVVNRVFDEAEGADVLHKLSKTAERFLGLPLEFLGQIYEDRNLMKAVKLQRPLLLAYPGSVASRCIKRIAVNLLEGGGEVGGLQGFLEKFLAFFRRY